MSRLQYHHEVVVIDLFCFFLNGKPVDNSQDTAQTAGEQFQNTHAGLAQHKAVDAENAKEQGHQKDGGQIGGYLFRINGLSVGLGTEGTA